MSVENAMRICERIEMNPTDGWIFRIGYSYSNHVYSISCNSLFNLRMTSFSSFDKEHFIENDPINHIGELH